MCRKSIEWLCSIKLSFSSFLRMDVLGIFSSFSLFVCFGCHSLASLCPHLHRRLPLSNCDEQFLFCCFLPKPLLSSNLSLCFSVLPSSSCLSPRACDLGWQFLSSERSASLFLRSALILPANRRGAPPTESELIGQTGRQEGASRSNRAGRDGTRAGAAGVSVSVRARTAWQVPRC